MVGHRFEETSFTSTDEKPADGHELVVITCRGCGREFFWVTESDTGDAIDNPTFCPLCGRKAI